MITLGPSITPNAKKVTKVEVERHHDPRVRPGVLHYAAIGGPMKVQSWPRRDANISQEPHGLTRGVGEVRPWRAAPRRRALDRDLHRLARRYCIAPEIPGANGQGRTKQEAPEAERETVTVE